MKEKLHFLPFLVEIVLVSYILICVVSIHCGFTNSNVCM